MPQPLSAKTISAIPSAVARRRSGACRPLHRVQGVDHQVEDHLLDLLAVDVGHHGLAGLEDDLLAPVLAHVADHLDHALDQAGQVGPLALDVVAAGEVEQLLGDALAAERLLLDHPQVVADDLGVGVRRPRRASRPRRFSSASEQKAIEASGLLISWATPGGEEADAGQPLGADELPAPLLDLPLEVGVGDAEPGGHVVERLGQVLHLVAGLEVDLVVERAPGHPADPALEEPDRVEHPAVEQERQAAEHRQDRQRRGPDDDPARLVLALRHRRGRRRSRVELLGQVA